MSEDQDKEFLESVARLQKRLKPELDDIKKADETRESDESSNSKNNDE